MEIEAALAALATEGWWARRSATTRRCLSAIARVRHYETGEALYLAGDPPNGVFGLVTGSFNLSFPRRDGEDYIVHRAGRYLWFGDLALFGGGPRLVSAHAAEPTDVVHLPPSDLHSLLQAEPKLYADFYAMTYENFSLALKVVTNLSIPSPEKRTADRLLIEVAMRADANGWISISHHQLAHLVALSLPTLQRVMKRFTQEGLVEQGYERLRVTDPERLRLSRQPA